VKVIKNQLNQNLNGEYFNDTPSNTIFSFGKFFITTNFDNKVTIDYTNTLSSFVNTITLETLNVSEKQSEIFNYYSTNAILNLDKSDLNTFVRYGSAYEFLRVSIQNIIVAYPGSLFANSQTILGGNYTYSGLTYNVVTNIATFYVPTAYTTNIFGIIINTGNETIPDDNKLKNLNESYDKYVIWSILEPNTLFPIVGYTGNTINSNDDLTRTHLKLQVEGNPFALVGTGNTANLDYHIRPNNVIFEEFKGTGNMELQLDRKLSNKRIYPSVDLNSSSTRREDLLLDKSMLNKLWILRNYLSDMTSVEAMEFLISRMAKTESNEEFLVSMNAE
ncbi:hypothetical protein LCGC14_2959820, partial [marine sediment metagenome]